MGGPELVLVAAIFLVASVVQAVTGFGFSLVAVPLLALIIGPVPAVVAATTASMVISVAVVRDDWHFIRWRATTIFTVAGIVGMPLGLYVINQVSARTLTGLMAVAMLVSSVLVATGATLKSTAVTDSAVGVTSGIMLTSTGLNGPPLVVSMQAMQMAPRPFRGTLSAVFLGQGVAAIALLATAGRVTDQAGIAALVAVPMLVAGWLIGNRVFHRIDPVVFRRVVLVMLFVTALVALGQALLGG